jgi:aspartyl/glutamyl-tRNA(Asn/Gln) amidotransferase C subunit
MSETNKLVDLEEDLRRVSKLARLSILPQEESQVLSSFRSILSWVESLESIQTKGTMPVASVVHHACLWREDDVSEGGNTTDLLAGTESAYDCFQVPKIIG